MGNDSSVPYISSNEEINKKAFPHERFNVDVDEQQFHKSFHNLTNYGYEAIWSARGINSIAPIQRIGHATAFSEEKDHAYIAYGVSEHQEFLTDVWDLDLQNCKWKRVPIDESQVSPRAGTRGVVIGSELWLFGGFYQNQYLTDLHVIDLETGEIRRPQTSGEEPLPCSGHSMTYYDGKIWIFGGYGNGPSFQCKSLDVKTLTWGSLQTNENKFSHSYCVNNGSTYLYGGSKVSGFVIIDHKAKKLVNLPTKGEAPSLTLTKSCLLSVGNYLISIGGSSKLENTYLPLRAYDIDRKTWFPLPVVPDGYSLSMIDGEVGENGIFNLPACTDFSAVYREKEREIVSFQGKPFRDPPVIIVLSMGETLAFLNHQTDMINMLH